MNLLRLTTLISCLLIALTGLQAQELRTNAEYQRTLNYGLIIHIELSSLLAIKPTEEMLDKRDEILPQIESLMLCTRESYNITQPKIADKKLAGSMDTTLMAEEKAIGDLKEATPNTNGHDLMSCQFIDYLFGDKLTRSFKKELDWNLANFSQSKPKLELAEDADYQRMLTCFLVLHDEINMLKRQKTADAITLRNKDIPFYDKLLKCAKESFQLAKPNITDPKKLESCQTRMGNLEKLVGLLKTYNYKDAPTWQMIDTILYVQVSSELEKTPYCSPK